MLEKPAIDDSLIAACLRDEYAMNVHQIEFLPIGADVNTAVYRAITDNAGTYFVKLRSGIFDEMSIIVPKLLHDHDIESIIAPLPTRAQQLWGSLDNFKVAVFPFIEGKDGYQIRLSDHHWIAFGQALKALHTTVLPSTITGRIQREQYSGKCREMVREFQRLVEAEGFADPVAAKLAAFLHDKRDEINQLVRRAEQLAAVLQSQFAPFVVCHGDIHAGNVLIDSDNRLYIVDWDTLILAPVERDLMFVGGGQFLDHRLPEEEQRLFYQGYGQTETNPVALAYYRYERIVQDIAAYCEQLLLTDEGGEDRENGLRQLMGQFQPNAVIDIAYRADRNPPELYKPG